MSRIPPGTSGARNISTGLRLSSVTLGVALAELRATGGMSASSGDQNNLDFWKSSAPPQATRREVSVPVYEACKHRAWILLRCQEAMIDHD